MRGLNRIARMLWLGILGAGLPSPSALAGERPCMVAIDVGHSPASPGAISASGVPEYEFNRTLSNALVEAFALQPGFQPILLLAPGGHDTRKPWTPRERAEQANALGADLLISVHHDSVQPSYLTEVHKHGKTFRYSRHAQGYSLLISRDQSCGETRSRRLAEHLGDSLQMRGYRATGHHAEDIDGEHRPWLDPERGIDAFDRLAVLRHATMPAVLVEAGVIVHPEEEAELANAAAQRRQAGALVAGIVTWWRESRQPPLTLEQRTDIQSALNQRAALLEFLGGYSTLDAESQALKDVRVYQYRVAERPHDWQILIAPDREWNEARRILLEQFGVEQLLEVVPRPLLRHEVLA
ncbi:N-acetylmuramoyl-L-alanine amidase [uncultured Thiocystis sp.]|uniref:N-acetylmuramoyl-L-alanine amidase n=1 Tax=uncultured Thiocystis sp. TaxID=1202134 RepID=UPI0025F43799|nr:N-acetylmuramoyl-L-alanine amidase [uncultured Thiocystis sp.]